MVIYTIWIWKIKLLNIYYSNNNIYKSVHIIQDNKNCKANLTQLGNQRRDSYWYLTSKNGSLRKNIKDLSTINTWS